MDPNRIEINVLLLTFAAVFAVELPFHLFIRALPFHPVLWVGAIRFMEIGLMLRILKSMGSGVGSIGLTGAGIRPGLYRGGIWSAGFGLLAGVAGLLLFLSGIDPGAGFKGAVAGSWQDFTLLLLVGGMISPVAEEILFRGVLYGFLRRWGVAPAVILSTLIFFLFHIPSGGSLQQVIGGLLFATAYEVEKNLWVPITIHMAANLAIFGISLIR
jgi:membrane protease YdiL (CAAX protease family)